MGSEGYLINEFLAARTNQRDDQWGGDYARRMRFAVEVVKAVRQRAGHDFIIIYRLSMLDLVNDGSTLAEVTELAKAIEAAGATIINTGIGWHEARIPTIATPVPRGAFSWVTRKLKGAVSIPLITTNRINDPQVAEDILARGDAGYGIDGPPVSCRRRNLYQKRRTIAPIRSTPASAAIRRVSIGSSSAKSPPVWSTRARVMKP